MLRSNNCVGILSAKRIGGRSLVLWTSGITRLGPANYIGGTDSGAAEVSDIVTS